jgi:hypothetical protein
MSIVTPRTVENQPLFIWQLDTTGEESIKQLQLVITITAKKWLSMVEVVPRKCKKVKAVFCNLLFLNYQCVIRFRINITTTEMAIVNCKTFLNI